MLPQIEVVLINWKRPRNIAKIVTALRNQTVPCTITICDCHPSFWYALSWRTLSKADRVYRWKHNLGAFSRYLPMAAFDHRYTFLMDDDMLPGPKCLEYFLESAAKCPSFGVLGQMGRVVELDGLYQAREMKRGKDFTEADFIVRAYFMETKNLHYLPRFRWLLHYFEEERPEDDLLVCGAMKFYGNLPCYLLPASDDRDTRVNKKELAAKHALSKRTDHLVKRNAFIKRMMAAGWTSVRGDKEKATVQPVNDLAAGN